MASWILRDPATLDDDEQARLKDVRARCPTETPWPATESTVRLLRQDT